MPLFCRPDFRRSREYTIFSDGSFNYDTSFAQRSPQSCGTGKRSAGWAAPRSRSTTPGYFFFEIFAPDLRLAQGDGDSLLPAFNLLAAAGLQFTFLCSFMTFSILFSLLSVMMSICWHVFPRSASGSFAHGPTATSQEPPSHQVFCVAAAAAANRLLFAFATMACRHLTGFHPSQFLLRSNIRCPGASK